MKHNYTKNKTLETIATFCWKKNLTVDLFIYTRLLATYLLGADMWTAYHKALHSRISARRYKEGRTVEGVPSGVSSCILHRRSVSRTYSVASTAV